MSRKTEAELEAERLAAAEAHKQELIAKRAAQDGGRGRQRLNSVNLEVSRSGEEEKSHPVARPTHLSPELASESNDRSGFDDRRNTSGRMLSSGSDSDRTIHGSEFDDDKTPRASASSTSDLLKNSRRTTIASGFDAIDETGEHELPVAHRQTSEQVLNQAPRSAPTAPPRQSRGQHRPEQSDAQPAQESTLHRLSRRIRDAFPTRFGTTQVQKKDERDKGHDA